MPRPIALTACLLTGLALAAPAQAVPSERLDVPAPPPAPNPTDIRPA